MRLSIVIPVFNEAKTIPRLMDRIQECVPGFHEIIVVDDASVDETAELIRKRVDTDPRIRLFRHDQNAGKTAALRTGFSKISGDVVVIQDADLEYDPADIPDLIAPIVEARGDICLGSRFLVKRAGRVLYYRHYFAQRSREGNRSHAWDRFRCRRTLPCLHKARKSTELGRALGSPVSPIAP